MEKSPDNKKRIWIVEDERSYREILRDVLTHDPRLDCDRDFGSAEAAAKAFQPDNLPDVVLVDLHLPGAGGIELIKEVKTVYPDVLFLVLTISDERATVFNAICMGASGYLIKSDPLEKIIESIQVVTEGGAPLSGSIASMVLSVFNKGKNMDQDCLLSERQTEILRMLSEGRSKKEIVSDLGIASHTVDFHLRKVYEKLQVNSQAGEVLKAIRKGLI